MVLPASRALQQLQSRLMRHGLILLGLTGGIATGKSTVAAMFAELGAKRFDFDVLAREVVEPGKPAWKDIVDFFGERVLAADQSLDRQAVSEIVFQDAGKRKKLEEITHPRIFEEFSKQIEESGEKNPGEILLAEIPLLIELDLMYLFHRVLLVYVPEKLQIERLARRNRIGLKQAASLVQAQVSIEKKREYADFIIDNSHSLDRTKAQVVMIWKEISRQAFSRVSK
ncbi:MAG: dephospho-CoA kinase [Desulfohalobiaceae bacterium]|nr:dephospho-CoA kinase [Desulfohalobiaceae bacterium]